MHSRRSLPSSTILIRNGRSGSLISAPTLMLAGGASSHVPQHLFTEALALLRDGRLAEIPVGHHIHRDAPDQFVAAVAAFLAPAAPSRAPDTATR